MTRACWIGLSAAALAIGVAMAADIGPRGALTNADPVRGKELASECTPCHDGDGRTRFGIYPRIAGQTYDYFLLSMKEFRSKERHQAYASLMWPSVEHLSDQDLRDLSAYYSQLPW
jgi:cytochrome c553